MKMLSTFRIVHWAVVFEIHQRATNKAEKSFFSIEEIVMSTNDHFTQTTTTKERNKRNTGTD